MRPSQLQKASGMTEIAAEFIEKARELLARECDKSSAYKPRARVYRNGRGDDLPELLALARFIRDCTPRPLHELLAEDEAARAAAAQPVEDADPAPAPDSTASLLKELRNEVVDWQLALCGEREGLDDLCNRVDDHLHEIETGRPA